MTGEQPPGDDDQKEEETPHSPLSFPGFLIPIPIGGPNQQLPPFLQAIYDGLEDVVKTCAERGYHCGHWTDDSPDGTECCRCNAVKGVSIPPPRLFSCPKLTKRITHYAHLKRWEEDGEVTECPGYNPAPNPLADVFKDNLSCAVCGGKIACDEENGLHHLNADGKLWTPPDGHAIAYTGS